MDHTRKKAYFSISRLFHRASAASLVLISSTIAALCVANSPFTTTFYFHVLKSRLFGLDIYHWVNDGLMTIFFFSIGMEIQWEIVQGELNSLRKASFPIFAALGGMIFPAIIYLATNHGTPAADGWTIPMATDIAFALGILALLGNRVPTALKVFLLALAVLDDLGAIAIIAAVYTREIHWFALSFSLACISALFAMRLLKIDSVLLKAALGASLWFSFLKCGIHPTLAGVLLGLFFTECESLENLIAKLRPWIAFVIMPTFAFANAGVHLSSSMGMSLVTDSVALGVFCGLVFGKPLGVIFAAYSSTVLGMSIRPVGVKWRNLFGAACLAGIGFTMAIFMTNLALDSSEAMVAKVAILLASFTSAVFGYTFLFFSL